MTKNADAFRTISEVADDLDLPSHVLRFWETKFPEIAPLKRAGGRRYYRPVDIEVLRTIRRLLHDEGYTIKGVQRLFKEGGGVPGVDAGVIAPASPSAATQRGEHGSAAFAADGATPSRVPAPEPAATTPLSADDAARPTIQAEAVLTALELLDECEDILARSRHGR